MTTLFTWKFWVSNATYNVPKMLKDFEENGEFFIELPDNGTYYDTIFRHSNVNLYVGGVKTFRGEVISLFKDSQVTCQYRRRKYHSKDKRHKMTVIVRVKYKYDSKDLSFSKAGIPAEVKASENVKSFRNFQIDNRT